MGRTANDCENIFYLNYIRCKYAMQALLRCQLEIKDHNCFVKSHNFHRHFCLSPVQLNSPGLHHNLSSGEVSTKEVGLYK